MDEPNLTILVADGDEDSRYLLRSLLVLKSSPFLSTIQLRTVTSHWLQAATHILRIRLNLTCSKL
jgi:hypothetical protein